MFYDVFVDLCNEKGVSPSKVAKDIGIQPSSASDWSRGAVPRVATMKKLADYFDVSIAYLMSNEGTPPKHPELFGHQLTKVAKAESVSTDDLAFMIEFAKLGDENKETVKRFVRFLISEQTQE